MTMLIMFPAGGSGTERRVGVVGTDKPDRHPDRHREKQRDKAMIITPC